MVEILKTINVFVWGVPALMLIVCVGIYLSIKTRFSQILLFPKAFMFFIRKLTGKRNDTNGVSSYQALCTALAATVGTGNLAGVAGAIAIGGPGAIFWMWICALLGMVTKFAEAVLAVRFRRLHETGECFGGPMYMIQQGLGNRWIWLGKLYCFFGVVAYFGAGNATQINAMVGGINSVIVTYGGQENTRLNLLIGIAAGCLIAFMLSGGAGRIGKAAEQLVPFASVIYLIMSLWVLGINYRSIPNAFSSIISGAFSPQAVTGGVVGSFFISLRIGASRGVFTNEAGMGTAGIAHAPADVSHPVEQGFMGIMEVFLDTIVICTMTALVILTSGVYIPYGKDSGVGLTVDAFVQSLGQWSCVPIAFILSCFAIATVLGWGLYGARCAQYLFGQDIWKKFAWISAGTVVAGAVLKTGTVWMFSETVNALMAIPNLVALALLSPELVRLLNEYQKLRPKRAGAR